MQLLFAHTLHPHFFQNNFKVEHGQNATHTDGGSRLSPKNPKPKYTTRLHDGVG